MPFFGIPGGFKDALSAIGRAAGGAALAGGRALGEELLAQAKPVIMNELRGAGAAARTFALDTAADVARTAGGAVRNVASNARGYIAGQRNFAPAIGTNDVAALGDRVRERAGAVAVGAKQTVHRVARGVANAGVSVLDKAAERLENMGDRDMVEENAVPLENDRRAPLENDRRAPRRKKHYSSFKNRRLRYRA